MPLLSEAEPTRPCGINVCLWTRKPSTSGCRYPAFYRTCACPSLTWGTGSEGLREGRGIRGARAPGAGPLTTETFLRARLSAGFSTITSNSHNHPADECYHCQRPNPTEEEPGAPSAVHVLLEDGGAGTLGGRGTRPCVLGARPPPLTPPPGRLTGARQTPTSLQGGARWPWVSPAGLCSLAGRWGRPQGVS